MINKYWACFFALILEFNATQSMVFGQSYVTGRLSEIDSEIPIEGATVIENGNSSATITDSMGHFELDISRYPVKLSFSHLGDERKVIHLTEQPGGELAIQLIPKKISTEKAKIHKNKIYFIHQEENQPKIMSLFSTPFVDNSQILEKQ